MPALDLIIQGILAARAGLLASECPYPVGGEAARWWLVGYRNERKR